MDARQSLVEIPKNNKTVTLCRIMMKKMGEK